jgi:hypothetical protein
MSQILEVAVGLVLVYYILGSIVSWACTLVTEAAETRGVALQRYLKKIAGDKAVDLTNLPQIKALQPIRYKNWWSVIGASTEPKLVEKIPASTLVDAFFDLAGLTGKDQLHADELISTLSLLPDSDGKQAMLRWIQQGITDINDLHARTNAYFCGILDQAAATFKANARSLVIIFSITITMLLGTDSIQLAKDLWTNAELRDLAAMQASSVVQQGVTRDVNALLGDLGTLSIKVGWWQIQNFPPQTSPLDWARYVLLKFLGLAITAAAVSQGSSFWYDLLKKVTSPPKGSSADAELRG